VALTVCTFLWDDPAFRWRERFTYGPAHVDRLAKAVRANLDMPYRFVVVTDYPADAFSEVDEVVPLWSDFREHGRCYTRLKCFDPAIGDILGERFVWLDLDCAVLGDLTPLFARTEDFVMWGFPQQRMISTPNRYCGSMLMMDAGARPEVYRRFNMPEARLLKASYGLVGSDQAWIEHVLGPDEAIWTAEDGVMSFKVNLDGDDTKKTGAKLAGRDKRFGKQHCRLDDARIVFFHGQHDPSMVSLQQEYQWIADYWSEAA